MATNMAFGCYNPLNMMTKNKLTWLQCMFGQIFTFLGKIFEKIQEFFCFECKFNRISYILANFHQIFNTKKMKNNNNGRIPFKSKILLPMNVYCIYFIIWCLWPFIETFCILIWTHGFSNISKYWQGNSLGTWNDQMYVTTYAFSMCPRIITILMQMNQNLWNYNVFNEKPRFNQISKIITSWFLNKTWFILSQQVQNTSLSTIRIN